VLEQFGFNLDATIQAQKNSPVFYGSEFKKPELLKEIFSNHPLWKYVKEILSNSASFPLKDIPEEIRKTDMEFHIKQGNHKLAVTHQDALNKIIQEDVERGFALILLIPVIKHINQASVAPLGCQKQWSINHEGDRVPKFRMTHDQSFMGPSGTSVNDRTITDLLPPLVYGFCLKRIIHYIVNLRKKHPSTKIFISKIDFDAAYHRSHMSARSAQESLTIFNGFLFMALRLTFGGSSCPNLWSCISEMTTDLCNMLIQNNSWDHKAFCDRLSNEIYLPKLEPGNIPFAKAQPMAVHLPENNIGKADLFIDDTILITLNKNDNHTCTCAAAILAIHTVAQSLHPNESIPRKEIISLKKFKAEVQPSEVKIVLGWTINTRTLRIYLPKEKFKEWSTEIKNIINQPKVSMKQMESLIGRLDHVASIMDILWHFMSRLRHALQRTRATRYTTLNNSELEDLKFLQQTIHIHCLNNRSILK